MRFGLMRMFPDATIGSTPAGANPAVTTGGTDDTKKKDQNVNTEKTVSVFSNYDKDQNKSVNYNEAKSNSLFSQSDFSNLTAAHLDTSSVSDDVKANIQKMAINKYNPKNMFASLLSNFNSKTGMEKLTFSDGNVDQSKVNSTAKGLDQIAVSDANTASQKANEQIMAKYTEALDAALAEYTANNNAANGVEANTDDLKGSKADPKQFDEAQNTKTKTETEVFSDYDKNKDKHVKYDESKELFQQSDLSNLKPSHMADTSNLGTIQSMANKSYNAAEMFKQELSNFDVKTGKETLKFNGDENQSQINSKIAEMNQKVETAATQANDKANKKVIENYTKALDKAFQQYTINPESAKDVETDTSPAQTTPKTTVTDGTPATDGGKHTISTTGDDTLHTHTGGSNGNRSISTHKDGENTSVTGFSFTQGEGSEPVNVKAGTDGSLQVVDADGKTIEGASVTDNGNGSYSVKTNNKTYTITVSQAKDDITAEETKETPANDDNQQTYTTYKIRSGDTLSKIAKENGVTVEDIMNANDTGKGKAIVNKNLIIANQEIKIPKKGEVS